MNLKLYLTIALFMILLVESTFSFFPFVFIFSCLLFFVWEDVRAFILLLIVALALDSLRVVHFGMTPIFLFASLFLLTLCRKIFNLQDPRILFAIVILLGIIYSSLAGYGTNIIFSLILFVIFLAGFKVVQSKNV